MARASARAHSAGKPKLRFCSVASPPSSLLHCGTSYNRGMVTTPQLRTMRRYAVAAGRIAASLVAVLFCKALNYLWPSKLRYAKLCYGGKY